MDIFKICAIGIITAVTAMILKENKSEMAVLVSIAGGILIILSVLDYFIDIISAIKTISDKSGIPSSLFTIVIKIVAIGYITDFTSGIVEDCGLKSLSDKIILGGKLIIMMVALPIVTMLFDTVSALIT